MKVEEILDLYDPCRDHLVWIATSLDVSMLKLMLGWQVQKSPYIKMEVDSIGVRDGNLAIWPTDESLKNYKKGKDEANEIYEKIIKGIF